MPVEKLMVAKLRTVETRAMPLKAMPRSKRYPARPAARVVP